MPELAGKVERDGIKRVFKGGVFMGEALLELQPVVHAGEVEWLRGLEYHSVLRKVAIMRVVQGIYILSGRR